MVTALGMDLMEMGKQDSHIGFLLVSLQIRLSLDTVDKDKQPLQRESSAALKIYNLYT